MRQSLIRRLATPVIAAGAAITLMFSGAGTAVADDSTPPPPAWSGDKTADNLRWSLSLTAVNGNVVDRTQPGVNVVHPGDTVTLTSQIWSAGGIGRYITGMRQIQPAGFEYLSHTVSRESSVTNGGAAGITAYCAGGGCSKVPILGNKGYYDQVIFAVTYQIPTTQAFGDFNAGFVFDVYAFGSQSGANPSSAGVRVVDPNVTTTATLTAPTDAKTGEQVDLSANVGPANAVGTVQFKDGDNNIGGPVTVSGGAASTQHTFDAVGAHAVTAVFTGEAGFHGATSEISTVNVTADTTTTLSAPATAVVGADVTIAATVTPADAVGTVQFKDGSVNVGEPVAVVNGQATITRTFVEAGSHNFTADFTSEAGFNASTSTASALNVTDADFRTTTTVLEPVTATVGVETNLSATVRPIPSAGQVEFTVDGVPVGTASVGTGDGVAVLPHTFDAVGTSKVVAKYLGTPGFTDSTSAQYSVNVTAVQPNRADTNTALGVTGSSRVGTAMTFTATVAPSTANGMIQFKVGTTPIGAPVAVVDGVATTSHTFETEGTYAVTAVFTGGDDWKDSVSGPTVVSISTATTPEGGTGSLGSLSDIFGS
ncbi:Ig-like domain-containing protein [Rhodococcus sp. ARC_M13]|uniref:Ig-like domain-containing protein n=1 Tax=Rhodococcus TaxID=1827 RepID=UPI0018A26840|nr:MULTISPECIES: Ig-like domain-containing protein [Rhodococcus]MBF7734415.1 Ig-like domain repeat protein [Rhodococcus erythropolis]MCJ0898301.1 Ig-like domain-containing protein [Rhodococcus sp. ARC_M13]MCZ4643406.1 Ig-like domain-containing protein [Rhodococcus erythropolis]